MSFPPSESCPCSTQASHNKNNNNRVAGSILSSRLFLRRSFSSSVGPWKN